MKLSEPKPKYAAQPLNDKKWNPYGNTEAFENGHPTGHF